MLAAQGRREPITALTKLTLIMIAGAIGAFFISSTRRFITGDFPSVSGLS